MSTAAAAPATLSERIIAAPARRRWAAVAIAALAWVAAYAINERSWHWLLGDVARLDLDGRVGSAVEFFVYDTIKIALLLTGIIFVVTVGRTFLSVERTRALLGGKREGVGNVAAAGLGVATPFCSCSAVPAFIGFVAAGVPVGVTLSFLIASPLVNEVAIALLLGMFGWGPTLLYVGAGLTIAVVAGWVLGRMRAERWVEPFVFETRIGGTPLNSMVRPTWAQRIAIGVQEVRTVLAKVWPYLLVGIGIGAAIHGWAPEELFSRIAGPENLLAVPAAVVLGVPLYSNAAGVLPLIESLSNNGVPMGTLLAFMMSVVALSLPELILLKRVLRPPLIAAFVGVVAAGIVAVGYLFNLILA